MRRTRQRAEQIVMDELRLLLAHGVPLTARGLIEAGATQLLHEVNRLGGLLRARRLVGVALPTARRRSEPRLDCDALLREIRRRHYEGEPLAASRVPPPLQHAAKRHLGSWRAAVKAAGLDYELICLRSLPSDEKLIAALRALAEARPELTWRELRRDRLAASLRSRFGSLEAALRQARIDDWPQAAPAAHARAR